MMMFDKQKAIGLSYGIAAIVATQVWKLGNSSGRKPTFISVAFFMSAFRFTLWWIGARRRKPAGFLEFQSSNLASVCRQRLEALTVDTSTLGAFNMTQPLQAKSVKNIDTNKIIIDGCDATGLSVEVLYQTQALLSAIIKQSKEHSDIH